MESEENEIKSKQASKKDRTLSLAKKVATNQFHANAHKFKWQFGK